MGHILEWRRQLATNTVANKYSQEIHSCTARARTHTHTAISSQRRTYSIRITFIFHFFAVNMPYSCFTPPFCVLYWTFKKNYAKWETATGNIWLKGPRKNCHFSACNAKIKEIHNWDRKQDKDFNNKTANLPQCCDANASFSVIVSCSLFSYALLYFWRIPSSFCRSFLVFRHTCGPNVLRPM